ncbi:aldehyde dehydrogenase family protein [Leucobacter ruminantium]|uniref:aldehyde dehydrogenase family protein n=1 Tax=Leucobacter ruminantium TaxID=1289170 RepID=UPI001FB5EA24|nr:proline dehydrogenase family protein [Leucobacter ruminantium]
MADDGSIVWGDVAHAAEARATAWLAALRDGGSGEDLLAGLSRDPESFEFTRRLIELVAGTDDAITSALGLREMAQEMPASMPARDRIAMRAGGAVSMGLPWAVMPVARKWLRDRVSHLVLATKLPTDAEKPGRLSGLAEVLRRHGEAGIVPVVEPTGDAVHGPTGAAAEAARLAGLAAHPLVKHLAVDPARLAPGGTDWSADDDLARASAALRPVLEAARDHGTTVVIAPSSVRWARLVPGLVVRALADPSLDRARVGVRLLAELPESRDHYAALSRWAQRRIADGGAPSEVVIGIGRAAGPERIASIHSGLAVPVIEDRRQATAQLLRLAELALHPGRAATLRPVIATEDVRVLAASVELAERLGSAELFSVQLRSGVGPGLAELLVGEAPEVRVALPVVAPQEFSGALGVLLGFAAEAADPASDVARLEAAVHGGGVDPSPEDGEGSDGDPSPDLEAADRERFLAAAEAAAEPPPGPHRTQLRAREWDPSERDSALFYRAPDEPARFDTGGLTAAVLGLTRGSTGELRLTELAPPRAIPVVTPSGFANEPETDASLPQNREWARSLLRRAAAEAAEIDAENPTIALSEADLDPVAAAERARAAGEAWAEQPPAQRAARLRRLALATVAARDRMLQSLARDTGAPVAELDREVDDIVDAARYSGQLAERLAAVRGATFVAEGLALVAADAAVPLSVQVEAVLAALAAGSGVLWTAPQRVAASARALLEEWEIGGLPAGTVRLEPVAAAGTLPVLGAAPGIDRAVVLGDRALARELAKHRPDLRIEGCLPAPGAILVAPSADFDAAIDDIVASAFAAAGAHPRSVHAAILLGSAARSRRFRDGLADAVRHLRVGDTSRPGGADPLSFDVGPLPAPPSAAGLRALTELGRGEEWLVRPERLDEEGLLWSPGVRAGVSASSTFWADAVGVPVLGLVHAHTLHEAIQLQNAGGAVAGLQSYDPVEVLDWLGGVEAAALSINRPTTRTRIERQPGGGWNDAVVGLPALSGGPNRLLTLGSWSPRKGTRSETLHLRGLEPEVRLLIESAQPALDYEHFDHVRRAALADALTWRTSFGVLRDELGLGVERDVLRYEPVPTHIRLAEGGSIAQLVRVLAAALLVRAPIAVSTGEVLPSAVSAYLSTLGVEVSLERDGDWVERLAVSGPAAAGGAPAARIRLIGGDRVRAAEWLGGLHRVALWAEPVTMAGPVELLTLLREQSISARAHRHGLATPVPGLDELLEG